MSQPPPDLSVVVVNYNTASYVQTLIQSLRQDSFQVDGRPGRLEMVVIDNASRQEDHARLDALRAKDLRLLRNTENVGYALANRQGLHVTRGQWHLVSNPDVRVLPGCLQSLIEAVESLPSAGLVGPRATMDAEGLVLMPPNELPDPYLEALTNLSRHLAPVARYNARRRARFAHRYWTARQPMALPMLSGSFLLGSRQTLLRHGLFDGGYPLYYEDTDLFRRYHLAGLKLWFVPEARIVHHFSRSAIPRMKAAMMRNHYGARRYFRRHFGEAGFRAFVASSERAARLARDHDCPFPLRELPPSADPPSLDVPAGEEVYLEVAGNAKFSLTVGIFPQHSGPFPLPAGFWEELACTHYWARAVDPRSGDTLKAWRITKCPRT